MFKEYCTRENSFWLYNMNSSAIYLYLNIMGQLMNPYFFIFFLSLEKIHNYKMEAFDEDVISALLE
jgi:hypothetical protein